MTHLIKNQIKPILFAFVIAVFVVTACKTTMSNIQNDLSLRLTEYTQCPEQSLFKHPLLQLDIDNKRHFAIHEDDFDTLEKYILNLEDCSRKRLIDIVERNRIIQELLKR